MAPIHLTTKFNQYVIAFLKLLLLNNTKNTLLALCNNTHIFLIITTVKNILKYLNFGCFFNYR